MSLPDYAFRKSGAQNKTSILFFRKFIDAEALRFGEALKAAKEAGQDESDAIASAREAMGHQTFLAEANYVGYTPTGAPTTQNDLYYGEAGGRLSHDQGM